MARIAETVTVTLTPGAFKKRMAAVPPRMTEARRREFAERRKRDRAAARRMGALS